VWTEVPFEEGFEEEGEKLGIMTGSRGLEGGTAESGVGTRKLICGVGFLFYVFVLVLVLIV